MLANRFACTGARLLGQRATAPRIAIFRSKSTLLGHRASAPLVSHTGVRYKWGLNDMNSHVSTPTAMGINIKPIDEEDALTTITQDDYAKMTMIKTSTNLLKVGAVTGISVGLAPGLMTFIDPAFLMGGSLLGSFGMALYSLYKIADETPKITYNKSTKKHQIVDSDTRNKYLNLFLVAEGITIAPMVGLLLPLAAPAALLTSGIMAGPIAAAYFNPVKDTSAVGSFLFTGLCGMVGLGITGLIFPSFGALWFQPEPYIGILLFSGYNWYDTQVMIESYQNRQLDPTAHSVNYTLNFINIFIRVLEVMARMQNQRNH